jgi:hypothetical protein
MIRLSLLLALLSAELFAQTQDDFPGRYEFNGGHKLVNDCTDTAVLDDFPRTDWMELKSWDGGLTEWVCNSATDCDVATGRYVGTEFINGQWIVPFDFGILCAHTNPQDPEAGDSILHRHDTVVSVSASGVIEEDKHLTLRIKGRCPEEPVEYAKAHASEFSCKDITTWNWSRLN